MSCGLISAAAVTRKARSTARLEYLMQLRRLRGFSCPRCGGRRARPSRRGLLRRGQCDYQASVTAGAIFQEHPPAAAHLVSGHVVGDQPEKRGEPSGTAKHFGSGKLPYRLGAAAQAAARDGAAWPRERLSGRVEIDETYVGGEEEGLRGRQTPPRKTVRG